MSGDGIRSARSLAIILIVHLAVIVLWQVCLLYTSDAADE